MVEMPIDACAFDVLYCARGRMASGGKEFDGAWLLPSFLLKGVIVMTDFEMISIVIMIVMLVFTVLGYCKKDK